MKLRESLVTAILAIVKLKLITSNTSTTMLQQFVILFDHMENPCSQLQTIYCLDWLPIESWQRWPWSHGHDQGFGSQFGNFHIMKCSQPSHGTPSTIVALCLLPRNSTKKHQLKGCSQRQHIWTTKLTNVETHQRGVAPFESAIWCQQNATTHWQTHV